MWRLHFWVFSVIIRYRQSERMKIMRYGNVLILGDSYSTFDGMIPEGYEIYYPKVKEGICVDICTKTWWGGLLEETGDTLVFNSSYGGTTFCHTGYNGEDCSHKSFITRMDALIADGFFKVNQIDTMFIFGGTNDSWANSPVGQVQYAGWKKQDLYSTLPAFSYLLSAVKQAGIANPIVLINDILKPEIVRGMQEICDYYGVQYIQLVDIAKVDGHPNEIGMEQIKKQILATF